MSWNSWSTHLVQRKRRQSLACVARRWTSFWELALKCYNTCKVAFSHIPTIFFLTYEDMNVIIIAKGLLPPTLSILHVPEVSCFRGLFVQLSAHLPPHLSLLAESGLQLGRQVVAGLGEGVWLTRCQTDMVQHALWAGHLLQVQVAAPVDRHVLV